MKEKDLIDGEIYVTSGKYPGYCFLVDKQEPYAHYMFKSNSYNSPSVTGNLLHSRNSSITDEYREATPNEKIHLRGCILMGKYIPFERAKELCITDYLIFN